MNKNILTHTLIVLIFTACSEPIVSSKAKSLHTFTYAWNNPSSQACETHGGEVNTKGICEATLKEAKAICQSEGNDLPTIEQIVRFSSECGAVSVPYKGKKSKFSSYIRSQREKNIDNQSYQQCVESHGINALHTYITKTTMPGYGVRTFRFRSANVGHFYDMPHGVIKYPQYVTCIKGK